MSDGPLSVTAGGLGVAIRLSPRATGDRLTGIVAADGVRRVLKATVTAPAEGGRANAALLRLLARSWGLAQCDLSIVQGITSRNKLVGIAGEPQQLAAKIAGELARLPGW